MHYTVLLSVAKATGHCALKGLLLFAAKALVTVNYSVVVVCSQSNWSLCFKKFCCCLQPKLGYC
jgi:hypothetical protein